ncbi:hypothetical protein D3C80_1111160 [compost metagenome]
MVRTLGMATLRTSAEAIAWMNWAVSKASRSTLSLMTKRLEISPRPTATERMIARLTKAYQRSRSNGLRTAAGAGLATCKDDESRRGWLLITDSRMNAP